MKNEMEISDSFRIREIAFRVENKSVDKILSKRKSEDAENQEGKNMKKIKSLPVNPLNVDQQYKKR